MPERDWRYTFLKLRISPSFDLPTEMELFQPRDQSAWFLAVLEREPIPLPDALIGEIETLLSAVSLTLKPDSPMGLDGTTYELELTGHPAHAQFHWWVEAPPEWKPLESIFELLTDHARGAAH